MGLEREDYVEPACPFETDQWRSEPAVRSIPAERIIEKLDEYYRRGDYSGAVELIKYWITEARSGRDLKGEFSLRNELIGIYRKTGKKNEAISNSLMTLNLIHRMDAHGSIAEGTALVNTGTVYKAFEMPEESLKYFEQAVPIYESALKPGDWRLGGLYNNMALTYADLKLYDEAGELFRKALDAMRLVKDSEAEQAITYLNMADLAALRYGVTEAEEEVSVCCIKAADLLDTESLFSDPNYPYYCRQCAPVFGYYGFFAEEEKLLERAEELSK